MADDPLDLRADQAFDQRRQVVIQPYFQQRTEFLAHQVLDRRATPVDLGGSAGRQCAKQALDRGGRPRGGLRGAHPVTGGRPRCGRRDRLGTDSARLMLIRLRFVRLRVGAVSRCGRRFGGALMACVCLGNRHQHGAVQHQHIIAGRCRLCDSLRGGAMRLLLVQYAPDRGKDLLHRRIRAVGSRRSRCRR